MLNLYLNSYLKDIKIMSGLYKITLKVLVTIIIFYLISAALRKPT